MDVEMLARIDRICSNHPFEPPPVSSDVEMKISAVVPSQLGQPSKPRGRKRKSLIGGELKSLKSRNGEHAATALAC
jgi:hypothetical protein